jgi:glycosyltransferase involved in cell wall biosynthesis
VLKARWVIITGEYPPQTGGVSDYTRILARALAASGDEVHVWAPAYVEQPADEAGVVLHRLRRGFGIAGLRQLGRELDGLPGPYRILIQYVPHAFGWKAMNVPFCCWLWLRRRTPIWVMFHEVVFPLDRSQALRHNVLGVATRVMARLLIRSSEKIFLSTPAWNPLVRSAGRLGKQIEWLPVPSNLGEVSDPLAVREQRTKLAGPQGILVGHFGTYGLHLRKILCAILPKLLNADPNRRVLLLGRGSESFLEELAGSDAVMRNRITALDGVSSNVASASLAACDLVVQPYQDGISTRRGSAMAALAMGVPIVTNEGFLSEPLWRESGVVRLVSGNSPESFVDAVEDLLYADDLRAALSSASRAFYRAHFAVERTLSKLREYSA